MTRLPNSGLDGVDDSWRALVEKEEVMKCFDAGFDPHEILKLAKIHVRERFQEFEGRGWE